MRPLRLPDAGGGPLVAAGASWRPASRSLSWPRSWPWPLPALGVWVLAWAVFAALRGAGAAAGTALPAACVCGLLPALAIERPWRRVIAAAGFPLSALLAGAALPAWGWAAAALPLALLYPLGSWRDAPWFPTPRAALAGIEAHIAEPPARVLDAGCGLGHGLRALRLAWPAARLHGIEWSRPLAALARFALARRGDVQIVRGDMWAADWSRFDCVYLFQRPESMARAWAKAAAELAPGAWLVSLEFAVPQQAPHACLRAPGRRPVWIYRIGRPPPAPRPRRRGPRSTAGAAGR